MPERPAAYRVMSGCIFRPEHGGTVEYAYEVGHADCRQPLSVCDDGCRCRCRRRVPDLASLPISCVPPPSNDRQGICSCRRLVWAPLRPPYWRRRTRPCERSSEIGLMRPHRETLRTSCSSLPPHAHAVLQHLSRPTDLLTRSTNASPGVAAPNPAPGACAVSVLCLIPRLLTPRTGPLGRYCH